MSTNDNYHRFLTTIVMILLVQMGFWFCMSESFNVSLASNFLPAVATWYGPPEGPGSGGACGLANDVAKFPYDGLISAGNNNLFQSGDGCGACYQVKCTQNPACSGNPVTVTLTDQCPGTCNNDPFHFDLSGKAFGYLAKAGQGATLRKAGRINVQYQRVQCFYKIGLRFKVDTGSNRYYLAFAIENVNGDGELGFVEILPSNSKSWVPMKKSFGATWKYDVPIGTKGPYSVRVTSRQSKKRVVAGNVIPANWAPGQYYNSRVNL